MQALPSPRIHPLSNRGIRGMEGKKTSVQCPLGRKLFNVKIATEMELVLYVQEVVTLQKKY